MRDKWRSFRDFHGHFASVLSPILGYRVSVQTSGSQLSACDQSRANVICPIRIVEADMEDLIKDYSHDKTVAFAHCVSSGFDMRAGVAKVFKRTFGRPVKADYINEHL